MFSGCVCLWFYLEVQCVGSVEKFSVFCSIYQSNVLVLLEVQCVLLLCSLVCWLCIVAECVGYVER